MKTKFIYGLVGLASFMSVPAVSFASGFQCSDSTGAISYSSTSSDGGACCGRSSIVLTYMGKQIKDVEYFAGMGGNPSSSTDTNPNLVITQGSEQDLGNSSSDTRFKISNFAVNITLSTADNSAPLPDLSSPAVISLVCTNRVYIGPPLP